LTKEQQQSNAQKLLTEYRPTIWRKLVLETIPVTGQMALKTCLKRIRFTQDLVAMLRKDKLLGEKLYWIIFSTYMTERQLGSIEAILDYLVQNYGYVPRRTYFRLRGRAIDILDSHLDVLSLEKLLFSS